ncbi:cellulose binding domain-containing protein [Micromonospora deserti]|uniref:cellulose binding domain-containing protein n=1 Tax=Micromonospora deserti TaxID=2070366 RepID=UPI0022783357|nr:cellulose binding domain-containing protein [Micromonospora deserti]
MDSGLLVPTTGQQAGQGWSATYRQSGTAVTATNVSYNGTRGPRVSGCPSVTGRPDAPVAEQ